MSANLLAIAHFAALAWMMFSLGAELALVGKAPLPRLRWVDAAYGLAAVTMLGTGIMRIFAEKGAEYYLSSPWFHVKVTAFILAALISAYPTWCFLRTPKDAALSASQTTRIRYAIIAQLFLIGIIITAAVFMARGW